MGSVISDPPFLTEMVDNSKRITRPWLDWLVGPAPGSALAIAQGLQQAVILPTTPVSLTAQAASITMTPFSLGTLPGGLYRLTFAAQITQAATVNSSLTLTFSWTSNGVAQTAVSAAITGNTTTTNASGSILVIADANAPLNWALAYVSNGATAMTYSIGLTIEKLS